MTALAPVSYSAPDEGPEVAELLEERYAHNGRSPRGLALYYQVKPLLPRRVQIALRRIDARQARRRHERDGAFPRWPIEPILVDRFEAHLRERLRREGADRVAFLNFWPGGHRFAFILTHDVEGPEGLANVERVLEIERRHGLRSSWNLVAEDYAIDPGVVGRIRDAGGEIGLHALHHDHRLFATRAGFEAQLPRIRARLEAWGAEGFRSPAMHRNAAWMAELGAHYDSSFPDTDPFEPQPGGCCSILPYFLGDVVELPITLVQDHTLFELLGEGVALWERKASWIAAHGGLVTVLVHPDYAQTEARLDAYDELLAFLTRLPGGWHALPRDVARWWRQRASLEAALARGDEPDAATLAAAGATVAWASERDGELVVDTGRAW